MFTCEPVFAYILFTYTSLLNLVSPIIEIFGFALLRIKSAYIADEFIVFVLTLSFEYQC